MAARTAAEAQAKAAVTEMQKTLADAVHRSAVASARQAAGAQLFKWVSIAVAVVALSLMAMGCWQFRRGEAAGAARGENQAKKECERATAAAAWVSTPEGRLAYELARVGSLRDLATCSSRGVAARDGWCVVQPERGKPFRWRLPVRGLSTMNAPTPKPGAGGVAGNARPARREDHVVKIPASAHVLSSRPRSTRGLSTMNAPTPKRRAGRAEQSPPASWRSRPQTRPRPRLTTRIAATVRTLATRTAS
jgi:hypothetical protein